MKNAGRQFRRWAKAAAYRSGWLPARHRREHTDTLTVVMFHRVLDEGDDRWRYADPEYAVSARFFDGCLAFFGKHYDVVGLDDVEAAAGGAKRLPSQALLITFDDGWSDNLDVAAQILRRHSMPAVVFLAVEAVAADEDEWWQERLFGAAREGHLSSALTNELLSKIGHSREHAGEPEVGELRLAAAMCGLPPAERMSILSTLPAREPGRRMMLRVADLPELERQGVTLAIHGYSHAPLTLVDAGAELRAAQEKLKTFPGSRCNLTTLAFPHGRHDERTRKAAGDLGFRLLFTSDAHINRTSNGLLEPFDVLGRISISQPALQSSAGVLREAELATWLWRRNTT